jgi:anthranilate phosphoribosyltransferase
MIQIALQKVVDGKNLESGEATAVMNEIMSGVATPAQIAAFLTALRLKGETVEEIAAAAQVMRDKATPVPVASEGICDTCGTGGDKSGTFNISTTAAFVLAGAGAKVAKHGNKAQTSQSGSADVLQALGVNLELTPQQVGRCIDQVGVGFMFAIQLHPAMKHAGPVRRELGIRTVFNLLGPLTNPAGARRQVMGVFDSDLTEKIAEVLRRLGAVHALVVAGLDGLDEITVTEETRVAELKDGKIKAFHVSPEDFGMQRARPGDLLGGDAQHNAGITRAILEGEQGPRRDITLLNAAAGLVAAGKAETLIDGVALAARSIDSGAAAGALDKLIQFSQKPDQAA